MLPDKRGLKIINEYMSSGLNLEEVKQNPYGFCSVSERKRGKLKTEGFRSSLTSFAPIKKKLISELEKLDLLVKTEDGTYTLRSEHGEELMHSRVGALTESVEKFVIPSNLENMSHPKILDLCSGMGYNAVAALHFNKDCEIDMVEISEETLFLSLCLDIPYKEHELVKECINNYFLNKNENEKKINLHVGDARKIIKNMDKKYNIVFHDAFSPQRDAVLYTVDFLKEIYKRMDDNGVLISYSSSIPFRSALVECGFVISEGPSVGRKRGATVAYKNPPSDKDIKRISEIDERLIALSTVGVPYRDKELNLNHEEIIKNREIEREELKEKLVSVGKYISTKKIKKGDIPNEFLEVQKLGLNSSEIIRKMRSMLLRKPTPLKIEANFFEIC
ncbi:MnmC family methyltransferase [Methanothermococcus thermolithotrophicus]|jgi:tRNA U34 5-methylaminomethyl-2-thiouridine-forming methyltransferase MnmC|uniref:MnmC family methyltransferase n=1 Tax=Methanothermococcus thermolithotrophicus TaxID=2186 RepID=UPI00037C7F55|nr:MnmC family methyltransferase [Methanothermococcus thermolithotrophicus]